MRNQEHGQHAEHHGALYAGGLLDSEHIEKNETNGQPDGDGLDGYVGKDDQVGPQTDEGERRLEEEREPHSETGDGSHQGAHAFVDKDVGAAGLRHGGGHFRFGERRRDHDQAGDQVGQRRSRTGNLGRPDRAARRFPTRSSPRG